MRSSRTDQFPRVAHIVTDLNGFGGTETALLNYLKGCSLPSDHHRIIVLKTIGTGDTLGAQMEKAGFSIVALIKNIRFSFNNVGDILTSLSFFLI